MGFSHSATESFFFLYPFVHECKCEAKELLKHQGTGVLKGLIDFLVNMHVLAIT